MSSSVDLLETITFWTLQQNYFFPWRRSKFAAGWHLLLEKTILQEDYFSPCEKLFFSRMEEEEVSEQDDFSCWKIQSVGCLLLFTCWRPLHFEHFSKITSFLEEEASLQQDDISCWKRQHFSMITFPLKKKQVWSRMISTAGKGNCSTATACTISNIIVFSWITCHSEVGIISTLLSNPT